MFSKNHFKLSMKDSLITLIILLITAALCFALKFIDHTAAYASMVFILAVFLISRLTHGYLYGITSSFLSVLLVNFIFTYPYFEFNFTLSGYPVTIICMLAVSIVTSTLTTQIKSQENIKIEAEREKTRSNLLRAVSHDLRTPLTSILGSSSAIIENDSVISSEERIKLLGEVKEDSEWLIRMVENLLTITRIDEDCKDSSTRIVKEVEAVEEVVSDAVSKFKKRFPKTNIIVKVPDELLMVPMDAILIEQVIINLLENAVLHGIGATVIELSVTSNEEMAIFVVADNGQGIAANVLPHIFDGYFSKSYEDKSDTKHNMGIGLSVCNTIIKAHSGKMTAENISDGAMGAKFSFYLPIN